MGTLRFLVASALLGIGGTLPVIAAGKSGSIKLDEIIFAPKHLAASLGPKALFLPDRNASQTDAGMRKLLRDHQLDQRTQFFLFPENAAGPDLITKTNEAPVYPDRLWKDGVSGSVKFLLLIGADGMVKSFFCYEASHQAFARTSAQAIAKWKFKPARIDGTPVPVLISQSLDFSAE